MLTQQQHASVMRAREEILLELIDAMRYRAQHDDWEELERRAVVYAANRYAAAHYLNRTNVAQVEAIEHLAVGHVDYAGKLALYVAELIHGLREMP